MIQLYNIEKYYGTRAVFRGISLDVGSGEFVAIMGSSGSGKSTLLNLIGGMDVPDKGMITVDREVISSYTEEQLTTYRRQKVGFIFQFFNLLPNITVYENIEIPLLLNGEERYEEKISAYLRQVGLEGRENDYPSALSGGEQQRVAIVRALVHEPGIILADEPTGNLDSRTGATIVELIRDAAGRNRRTVVMVTHNESVAEYAGRIIKIQDGTLLP
ncbi:MAG TPA: ABC transporter ATP-binding protein [Nitrospirota bacterium]|nr:ABC transporter ATP-binding protein [Nitrospirota bacterium]